MGLLKDMLCVLKMKRRSDFVSRKIRGEGVNNKLKDFTIEDLCRIRDKCNRWEWPSELGDKPEGYDKLSNFPNAIQRIFHITTKHDYIWPIINAIERIVPRKEISRYNHIHKLGYTNDEFEMWWFLENGGAFSGNPKVAEYFSRLLERL